LIKAEYADFDQIVEDTAIGHEIDGVGTFYVEDSHPRQPTWFRDFFGRSIAGAFRLITSSAKGVLLVKLAKGQKTYTFAVVFGHGRYLLTDGVIEERFGLKVVLNTVNPESLRSIDKTTLGSVPKQSREQMSREGVAANFGIDIEQDLINSVTGRSRDGRLGKTISGRDALAVSVKVDVKNINDFLRVCVEQYESDAYKADFGWIDQIKGLRNLTIINELNAKLIARIAAGDLEKIWMAVPEVVDWVDVKGFRFTRSKKADLKADLDLGEFLASLDGKLSLDLLKQVAIYVISARTDEPSDHWTAYKCLYAELDHQGSVCVLNNGKWYEIVKDFTLQVQNAFDHIPESTIALPEYNHPNEGAYNDALPAAVPNSFSMDRQMILHGGGHSSIEFCDLGTQDKKLVHIKRYGSATQLSHLFAQGVVSGELFVQDENFRRKLNEKLPAAYKLPDVAVRPNPNEYEIIFGIISKSANPLDIPFFSKVSLRNAYRRLQGYGYTVTKKKIAVRAA
jgi:uncharacterized protein (TIGR04141 family)